MGLFDWLGGGTSGPTQHKRLFARIEDGKRYAGRVNGVGEYIAHDGYNWGRDWERTCHDCLFCPTIAMADDIGCYLLAERGHSREAIRQFRNGLGGSRSCPDYGMSSFAGANPSDTDVRVTIRLIARDRGWDSGSGLDPIEEQHGLQHTERFESDDRAIAVLDPESGAIFSKFIKDYQAFVESSHAQFALSAPSDHETHGLFSYGDLDTQFGFVNPHAKEWVATHLAEIEKHALTMAPDDLHRALSADDFSRLDSVLPGVRRMLQYREVMVHENFHTLQAFTLSSVFQLVAAFQRIAQGRTTFAFFAASMKTKFSLGYPVFEVAERIDNEAVGVLKRYAITLQRSLNTVQRAFQEDSSGLAAIHLIEGAAYMAQKLVCRSLAVETLDIGDKPFYGKAWTTWRQNGGSNELAFLLAADVALRFGNLDNDYDDDIRPEKLFGILAAKARNIEQYFPDEQVLGASIGLSLSAQRAFTGNPAALGYLRPDGQRRRAVDALVIPRDSAIGRAEIQSLMEFSTRLVLEFPAELRASFRAVTPDTFAEESIGDYMGVVGRHLYEAVPALGTQEFLLHWIFFDVARDELGHALAQGTADKTPGTISVGPMRVNALEYRLLSSMVASLETLLLYSPKSPHATLPYCCARHGIPRDFDVLPECMENDSLNLMCERNLGGKLRDIVMDRE